jgi:HK97 family phage prohead protease
MPDDHSSRAAPALHLRASFEPSTWNADARTIDVIWTTGADVTRTDYWTGQRWIERLEVTAEAIDLGRMNSGAPVLNTHSSYSLGDVVGVVERAWVENGRGMATLRFSDRPEVASIIRDVAAGILRNISVGYGVEKWEVIDASKGGSEIRTAKRWTPYEVSLVPIPADAGAQVRGIRALPPDEIEAIRAEIAKLAAITPAAPAAPKESNMPDIDPAADAAARTAEIEAARTAERARVAEIMTAQRQAGLDADWGERHIGAGTAADAARTEALAEVAKRATPRVAPQSAGAHQDATETHFRLLANALEHRANPGGVKLEDGARQFRGFQLSDFARAVVEANGYKTSGMTKPEIAQLALSRSFVRNTPGLSSSDFPNLLANTASKSLRMAYDYAPRSFLPFTSRQTLPDFKSFRTVALSGAPQLAVIPETGAVSYGTLGEGAETWNLTRYGRAISIGYVAIVNDDMSGFTRIPMMYGAEAAALENSVVWTIITANANLADGGALFNSTAVTTAGGHANLFTGGTSVLTNDAAGIAAVGQLQTRIRLQRSPSVTVAGVVTQGRPLNLTGRFLAVPAALEPNALALFSNSVVPATTGASNPYRSQFEVVVEPLLDAVSATAYYLIAEPTRIDTIQYGYLEGEEGPMVSSNIDFDTDGVSVKCMHNFGAKAIDFRGMARSAGA